MTKYLKNVDSGVIVAANEYNVDLPYMEPYEFPVAKKAAPKKKPAKKDA